MFVLALSSFLGAVTPANAQEASAAGAANGDHAASPTSADATSAQPAGNNVGAIGEIVVTAERKAQSIQKTPIAMSVITGSEIAREGRDKLDDVLVDQPAVVVQGAAKGFLVSIRGLGLSLPAQNGQGAVSTNYDGVYNGRSEPAATGFYDLDRVEVLRGPQSTLYGRTGIGGVVNIISRDPELGHWDGYVQGEVGDYSLYSGQGAVNVPIGDELALRVSGAGVHRDGYLNNGHDDNKASSFRGKLLFKPNDDFSLLLGAEHSLLGGKGPGAIPIADFPDHQRTTDDPSYGYQHFTSWKVWASLNASIGPGNLSVLPSFFHGSGTVLGAFGGNFSYTADPKKNDQTSVEVRYASKAGSPFDWAVGLYHYDQDNSQAAIAGACNGTNGIFVPDPGFTDNPNNTPPGVKPMCFTTPVPFNTGAEIRKSHTDGVFGQSTIPLAQTFRFILGARYSWEGISGSNDEHEGCFPGSPPCPDGYAPDRMALADLKDQHFDFRAGFEYNFLPQSMLYFTAASGYRQGGYSFGIAPDSFKPEKMRSYEVGVKNKFLDGRLLINGDFFYYDYDSYQLVLLVINPPGSAAPFALNIDTTPAREYGAEGEATFALTNADRLNASVTYLNSRIKGDTVFRGGDFPNTPKWQIKGGYSHNFTFASGATLGPRIDLRYLTSQFVYPRAPSDSAAQFAESTQKAYFTGDAFLSFTSAGGKWSVTGYLKNLNNKAIKQSDFFGYVQVAAPRTYGATVHIDF